jgi:hypothetical protein
MPNQSMVGGVLLVGTHSGMKHTGTQKRLEIIYSEVSYGDEMYGAVMYRAFRPCTLFWL